MYEKLKMNVSSATFLQKLNSLSLNPCGTSSASTLVETEGEKFWPLFPYDCSTILEDHTFLVPCLMTLPEDPSLHLGYAVGFGCMSFTELNQ